MKILYVVKNLRLSNGVSSYIMNYYRKLILNPNIKIDFLIVNDTASPYYEEIRNNGGNIHILPSYKKEPLKLFRYINKLYKNEKYDIVHCNVINSGSLILLMARLNKVPVRILHSHATQNGDNFIKQLCNFIFKKVSMFNSNYLFACSYLAGEKLYKKRKFYVINNAIDVEKYDYNEKYRTEIRKEECCNDKKVIMTVGRITKQKNPYFIIDILKKIKNDNYVFWWFGNGDMDEEIKEFVDKEKMEKIKFWGAINDVNKYYSAADIFILPSLYEGLPVVGIEAQISGIKCFFSDTITKETAITSDTIFLTINDSNEWAKNIEEYNITSRLETQKYIDTSKYEIEKEYKKLENIYTKILKENRK